MSDNEAPPVLLRRDWIEEREVSRRAERMAREMREGFHQQGVDPHDADDREWADGIIATNMSDFRLQAREDIRREREPKPEIASQRREGERERNIFEIDRLERQREEIDARWFSREAQDRRIKARLERCFPEGREPDPAQLARLRREDRQARAGVGLPTEMALRLFDLFDFTSSPESAEIDLRIRNWLTAIIDENCGT